MAENPISEIAVFECDRCGACCRHLKLFGQAYASLDRGDGICRHLDPENNLCRIYENRPLICNVREGYKVFFSDMPYDEYIAMTVQGCEKLKALLKQEKEIPEQQLQKKHLPENAREENELRKNEIPD